MIQDKLDRFINNENRTDFLGYSLDHVRALLGHFGDPHRRVRMLHIAGTNGKGSVAHMLHGILTSSGYKTGLYTSPHLTAINERIMIGGETIPDDRFNDYVDDIIGFAETAGLRPTFFDILTVCAFRYFRDCGADAAVIETGLGGRRDSTNVITPLCSVITSISRDHANILGESLESITGEKAGIIKHAVPVVTSNGARPVIDIIAREAAEREAPLFALGRDFFIRNVRETDTGFRFDYRPESDSLPRIDDIALNNPLAQQITNSSLAITAAGLVQKMLPGISAEHIRSAMGSFSVPGRLQTLSEEPRIIFDPAHNEAAITVIMDHIAAKQADRSVMIVLTLMKDKEIGGILSILKRYRMPVLYFSLSGERCYRPSRSEFPELFTDIIDNDETALAEKLDALISGRSLFLFIGSFRLYDTAVSYARHASGRIKS